LFLLFDFFGVLQSVAATQLPGEVETSVALTIAHISVLCAAETAMKV